MYTGTVKTWWQRTSDGGSGFIVCDDPKLEAYFTKNNGSLRQDQKVRFSLRPNRQKEGQFEAFNVAELRVADEQGGHHRNLGEEAWSQVLIDRFRHVRRGTGEGFPVVWSGLSAAQRSFVHVICRELEIPRASSDTDLGRDLELGCADGQWEPSDGNRKRFALWFDLPVPCVTHQEAFAHQLGVLGGWQLWQRWLEVAGKDVYALEESIKRVQAAASDLLQSKLCAGGNLATELEYRLVPGGIQPQAAGRGEHSAKPESIYTPDSDGRLFIGVALREANFSCSLAATGAALPATWRELLAQAAGGILQSTMGASGADAALDLFAQGKGLRDDVFKSSKPLRDVVEPLIATAIACAAEIAADVGLAEGTACRDGDEFIYRLPADRSAQDAADAVRRLSAALKERAPRLAGMTVRTAFRVRAYCGSAMCRREVLCHSSPEDPLRIGDPLYVEPKNTPKNFQCLVHRSATPERALRDIDLMWTEREVTWRRRLTVQWPERGTPPGESSAGGLPVLTSSSNEVRRRRLSAELLLPITLFHEGYWDRRMELLAQVQQREAERRSLVLLQQCVLRDDGDEVRVSASGRRATPSADDVATIGRRSPEARDAAERRMAGAEPESWFDWPRREPRPHSRFCPHMHTGELSTVDSVELAYAQAGERRVSVSVPHPCFAAIAWAGESTALAWGAKSFDDAVSRGVSQACSGDPDFADAVKAFCLLCDRPLFGCVNGASQNAQDAIAVSALRCAAAWLDAGLGPQWKRLGWALHADRHAGRWELTLPTPPAAELPHDKALEHCRRALCGGSSRGVPLAAHLELSVHTVVRCAAVRGGDPVCLRLQAAGGWGFQEVRTELLPQCQRWVLGQDAQHGDRAYTCRTPLGSSTLAEVQKLTFCAKAPRFRGPQPAAEPAAGSRTRL